MQLISNIQETRLKLLEEQLANLVAARKEKVVKSSDMIPANINSTARLISFVLCGFDLI